ncbi:ubiquitin carboxyl-terminal hydrolase [Pisolithus sp. B1]|nr:ubiquitin carboxyl-terminal hydrolase [Pisolithus sp. B1]
MSGDDDSSGWHLTESDPAVFTELLKTLGTPYIVDDLHSLDPDALSALQPICALIFLFKCLPLATEELSGLAGEYDPDFTGFFAYQTVNNACATLAVINALGNIPSLKAHHRLTDLLNFTIGMDPQTCGMTIASADWLREAHNDLSPPSTISLDGLGIPKKTEDAYHFVVYLPVSGSVYELDGLKPYPVRHGTFEDSDDGWLRRAREVIENRIATYPPSAVPCWPVRDDPLPAMNKQLELLRESGSDAAAAEMLLKISDETSRREQWAFENSLRRHNHISLAHATLLALEKAGLLQPAIENARKVMRERAERRRQDGFTGMDED